MSSILELIFFPSQFQFDFETQQFQVKEQIIEENLDSNEDLIKSGKRVPCCVIKNIFGFEIVSDFWTCFFNE